MGAVQGNTEAGRIHIINSGETASRPPDQLGELPATIWLPPC